MSKLKLSSNASGSGNVTLQSPNTDSDFTVTVPTGTGALPLMKLETAVTASGTSVDFTSIPSWVKRITVMFSGVSTNGTSVPLIQLGTSGGVTTTGYSSFGTQISAGAAAGAAYTTGFGIGSASAAASTRFGAAQFTLLDSSTNTWAGSGVMTNAGSSTSNHVSGGVALSGVLTQVRITTVNGTDTFDAGTINILYEG